MRIAKIHAQPRSMNVRPKPHTQRPSLFCGAYSFETLGRSCLVVVPILYACRLTNIYSTMKEVARQSVWLPTESEARTSRRYSPFGSSLIAICSAMGITVLPV